MASIGGRSVCVCVNLDNLTHNITALRNRCPSSQTGVIGVVKAGGYGHGSVGVSRHLKKIGVERLAVATIQEGVHLRKQGLHGPIHVFGNVQSWEMRDCVLFGLIPTVSEVASVEGMAAALHSVKTGADTTGQDGDGKTNYCDHGDSKCTVQSKYQIEDVPRGSVNIKIDSGMSRNGCQPEDLASLVQSCQDSGVPMDAMFTHFADSWGDPKFTQKQLDLFLQTTDPFMHLSIKRHVANSGAILRGIGVELDFIRPGISIYGLPPDNPCEEFQAFGLKPVGSLVGYPTLVKKLSSGRHVGYSMTHTTTDDEWVATFPLGYADGYWRHLSSQGVIIRDKTGERCPVIGRVSMDAITAKVPADTSLTDSFTLMSADYDPITSACGIAATVGTISYEVGTRLSLRFPRVYTQDQQHNICIQALSPDNY